MTKDEIFNQIKLAIMEVLPNVAEENISRDKSLTQLGANSIDRGEIVLNSMMDLGIKVPLVEIGSLKNIGELVDFYYSKLEIQ